VPVPWSFTGQRQVVLQSGNLPGTSAQHDWDAGTTATPSTLVRGLNDYDTYVYRDADECSKCVTLADKPAGVFGRQSALKWGCIIGGLRFNLCVGTLK